MQSAICDLQSAVCSLQSAVCKCQTLEMLWEHEPQASVSTAFSGSPKVSRVLLYLHRNTINTATKKKKRKKKREKLVIFEYQS